MTNNIKRREIQLRIEKASWNSPVKALYFEAFPKAERMPFPLMIAMSKLGNTDFLTFYDHEQLCGFIYLAKNRKLVFVMFLAVAQSLRSQGYGSAILRMLNERYPDHKIIVTIEPCDPDARENEIRTRRKAFYIRNGFQDTGWKIRMSGLTQTILIAHGDFRKRELRLFLALYSCGALWPKIWQSDRGDNRV